MCMRAQNFHVYFQPQPVIRPPVSTSHLDPCAKHLGMQLAYLLNIKGSLNNYAASLRKEVSRFPAFDPKISGGDWVEKDTCSLSSPCIGLHYSSPHKGVIVFFADQSASRVLEGAPWPRE
ncbi:hypothetical protein AVEN_159688-1 [Araneus ventricosus]|uniref:Uncharacterized protein n=1 Tax=Araneus ventricosus TaxID=182803 RepID=A0A4Y2N090_ARAVE|nr:hypothetical protein AVEN_159688-1 [Araneus ventricosus]